MKLSARNSIIYMPGRHHPRILDTRASKIKSSCLLFDTFLLISLLTSAILLCAPSPHIDSDCSSYQRSYMSTLKCPVKSDFILDFKMDESKVASMSEKKTVYQNMDRTSLSLPFAELSQTGLQMKITNVQGDATRTKRKPSSSGDSHLSSTPRPSQSKPPLKKYKETDHVHEISEIMNEADSLSDQSESEEQKIEKLVKQIEDINTEIEKKSKSNPSNKKKKKKKAKSDKETESNFQDPNSSELQKIVDTAVENVMKRMMPVLVTTITQAVKESTEKRFDNIESELKNIQAELYRERVQNAIRFDKSEQYSRNENLLINGIIEDTEESESTLLQSVMDICEIMKAEIRVQSITSIHRVGKKRDGKSRSVIVRLAKISKKEIVQKRKLLKNNDQIKQHPKLENKVYVNDDVTEPRRKLQECVREIGNVDFCFFRDGTLICKKGSHFIHVDSADDLFKLGIDDVDYRIFYKDLR